MRATFNASRSDTRGEAGASAANAHKSSSVEEMSNEARRMGEAGR